MADLTIGKTNVTKLLREKAAADKTIILLIQVPPEKYMDVSAETLRVLINEMKIDCIYITLSKSFDELDKLYKSKGIDTSRLFFIDAISNMYGLKKQETKRCIYVSGPLDVDSISSSLRKLLSSLGAERKCVFLDSVTTLLLYNSLPRTIRFSQFLTKTLKSIGADGVIVNIAKGETTEKLVKALSKLCDEVIDIPGE